MESTFLFLISSEMFDASWFSSYSLSFVARGNYSFHLTSTFVPLAQPPFFSEESPYQLDSLHLRERKERGSPIP